MTIKRLILIFLTILAIAQIFGSLKDSFGQPQVQSRLELYQSNLVLHAAELESDLLFADGGTEANLDSAKKAFLGAEPYDNAKKQHEKAIEVAQTTRKNIEKLEAVSPQPQQLQQSLTEIDEFIAELNLKIGILEVDRGNTLAARERWSNLTNGQLKANAAEVLQQLWDNSTALTPKAETILKTNLDGWFEYRALRQLYRREQRTDDLTLLQQQEQKIAQQAFIKLALIGGIPIIGGVIGVSLLVFAIVQWLLQKERSLLATNSNVAWETPWDGETVWQVLIVGFFFLGQFLLPILFGLLGFNPSVLSLRFKAFYVLLSYILLAVSGLGVLYFSIKSFLPLPKDWFRFQLLDNWWAWGLGGYLVALPLVVLVSLINQQLWQGQGGSNPILFLALQAQDKVALAIFLVTASVAAPLFEEIIFRGFLLSSLTRYFPVWGSIVISSLIFSVAHLSVSEILPLTVLGMVLGFVYTRSRNLLAPIFLHSLWNSGTLFGLIVLGSQ